MLFFGEWLVHDLQIAAYNSIYALIAVYALRYSENNRFSLDHVICSRCCCGKKEEPPTCCK